MKSISKLESLSNDVWTELGNWKRLNKVSLLG